MFGFMVQSALENRAAEVGETDKVVAAVEELVGEFGIRGVVTGFLRSSAGGEMGDFGQAEMLSTINWILARIIDSSDPRMEADIMAIGSGLLLRMPGSVFNEAARTKAQEIIDMLETRRKRNPLNATDEGRLASAKTIVARTGYITAIAEKYGVTRADISKRGIEFCEKMGLPPSRFQRSEADRETYSLSNRART